MKKISIHIGEMSPERAACIESQRRAFNADYEFLDTWPDWFKVPSFTDIREAKDQLFIELVSQGFYCLDSDLYINSFFEPTDPGIWLPHSFGRPDYFMIAAIGPEALEHINGMIGYSKEKKRPFMWVLEKLLQRQDLLRTIPAETYTHHAILTRDTNYEKQRIGKFAGRV